MAVQYLDPLSMFSGNTPIFILGEPSGVDMVEGVMNTHASKRILVTVTVETQNVVGSI